MRTITGEAAPRRAVIIGGSMAGLFAQLYLARVGWHADVYERTAGQLSARGAGIVTHPELRAALADVGIATDADFGVALQERVVLDGADQMIASADVPQIATSWTHVHAQLLARVPEAGIRRGAELVGITQTEHDVTAHFADGRSATGDVLLGADGVRSVVRRHIFPTTALTYAGYVAWRGLAPEAALTDGRADPQVARFAFCLPPGEHMLGYLVPGPGHDLAPGRRSYNFVWYRPADKARDLPRLLTDQAGMIHPSGIAPSAIASDVVNAMRADAKRLLAPWFRKVVAQTAQPFLQPIYDLSSTHMHAGRIALLGDAAFVVRPHVGGGVVKAAQDAAALAHALEEPGVDPSTALAAYSAARTPIGHRMIAQARLLGSPLKSTYASVEDRAAAEAMAAPAAVLQNTARIDFLRQLG